MMPIWFVMGFFKRSARNYNVIRIPDEKVEK